MSVAQGEDGVLIWITRRDEVTYAVDVARHFGLSAGRVANVVRHLEHKGLIERYPEPDDLRRSTIVPTEQGREHAADLYGRMASGLQGLLESFDDEETAAFIDLTTKFLVAADGLE